MRIQEKDDCIKINIAIIVSFHLDKSVSKRAKTGVLDVQISIFADFGKRHGYRI